MRQFVLSFFTVCFALVSTNSSADDDIFGRLRDCQLICSAQCLTLAQRLKVEADGVTNGCGSSGSSVVCSSMGSNYFVPSRALDGRSIGNGFLGRENCQNAVDHINQGVICAATYSDYYIPTRVDDGASLGSNGVQGLDACLGQVAHISHGLICGSLGGGYFIAYNIRTGAAIGSNGTSLQECLAGIGAQ